MEIHFDWPKIHESVLFETANGEKFSQIVARRIELAITQDGTPRGGSLGTSPELCERFAIGRETLLEASRLLEGRGIARMRRGPHGGLMSLGRPAGNIATTLKPYLLGLGMSADQINEAKNVFALLALYDHQARNGRGEDFVDLFRGFIFDGQPEFDKLMPSGHVVVPSNPYLKPFVDTLDELDTAEEAGEGEGDARSQGLVGLAVDYLAGEVARMRGLGAEKLGSEAQIAERIGVSRQVLRQAMRLLEDQGLLICRRGRSKGVVRAAAHSASIVRAIGDYYFGLGIVEDSFRNVQFMLDRINRTLFAMRADNARFDALLTVIQQKDWQKPDTHIRRMHIEWPVINNPALTLLEQALSGYRARRAGPNTFTALGDIGALQRNMLEHYDFMRAGDLAGADRCYMDTQRQVTVLLKGH